MKKRLLFVFAVLLTYLVNSQDGFAQCGDRFREAVFTGVTATNNVVFSPTYNLKMNVYQPTGDTATMRPMIIMAHGGSFIGGTKDESTTVDFCRRFAKHGYVTVSIDYRLATLFDLLDSIKIMKEVVRAVQDMKTTIRYFHHDAATANTYKIDTTQIFVGGESAGAILAVHLAYLNDLTELEPYIVTAINAEGGIDGTGGYPQYGSQVRGVVNFCGAINKAQWIDAGETPIVSVHGNADGTVPYNHAEVFTGQYPINLVTVDGSGIIQQRANEVGVYNDLWTLEGQDHMAHASAANIGQSETFVMEFLYPLIDCTNLYQAPAATAISTPTALRLGISPNPTTGIINLSFDEPNSQYQVQITDATGKIVAQGTNQTQYDLSQLPRGLYLAYVQNGVQKVVQKIILQ